MSKPIISYVIPCYNCQTTIADTVLKIKETHEAYRKEKKLPSLWDQIEVICVNDGSTDFTKDVLDAIAKDNQNMVVIHNKNHGKGISRNIGNRIAKADIIAVSDSDDWPITDRTAYILKTFEVNPEKDIFYSSFITHHVYSGEEFRKKAGDIDEKYLWNNGEFWVAHSTMAYRKEVILKEPYSEDKNKDDWSLIWNFYSKGYEFCYSDKYLMAYRLKLDSIIQEENPDKIKRILEKKRNIMRPFYKGKGWIDEKDNFISKLVDDISFSSNGIKC